MLMVGQRIPVVEVITHNYGNDCFIIGGHRIASETDNTGGYNVLTDCNGIEKLYLSESQFAGDFKCKRIGTLIITKVKTQDNAI